MKTKAPRKKAFSAKRVTSKSSTSIKEISPLAPMKLAILPPLAGVRLAAAAGGIRYPGRADVMMAVLAPETQVAGVFTRSRTAAAPVEWCRASSKSGITRGLVVNSGNANAFTGKTGEEAVRIVAESAAGIIGCRPHDIMVASTGVIGEPLATDRIVRILPHLAQSGAAGGWRGAAEAIMTTDTFPKLSTASARIETARVTINGIAKGSGMVAPNMATMLGFIFTDAAIPAPVLQEMLTSGANISFNAITVDGDTSTNDTLLAFATGKGAPHPAISRATDKRLADFKAKLNEVLLDLALQIVKDGEGARKLIQIDVAGAESDNSARIVAASVANSPLVKTAIGSGDANWGRIVMAIGKAGEPADRDRLKISFGNVVVAEDGARAARYDEKAATRAVSGREVQIAVDLGIGRGCARMWTCDFTEGYIRINSSYRS